MCSDDSDETWKSSIELARQALAEGAGRIQENLLSSRDAVKACEAITESPIEQAFARRIFERSRNHLAKQGREAEPFFENYALVIPQYKIGSYRLDFAIFVRDERGHIRSLNIECDGKAYHSTAQQRARDKARNEWLGRRGWLVYRFTGGKLYHASGEVADEVDGIIDDLILGRDHSSTDYPDELHSKYGIEKPGRAA